MFWRLRQFLTEHEILIALGVFGFGSSVADIIYDFGNHSYLSGWIRLVVLIGFVAVIVFASLRRKSVAVPLALSNESDVEKAAALYNEYVNETGLKSKASALSRRFSFSQHNFSFRTAETELKLSQNEKDWEDARIELLGQWEQELDVVLRRSFQGKEGYVYQVFPHVPLPLSFALGASVGLRRPLILYHQQDSGGKKFHRVIDLTNPRDVLHPPDTTTPKPETVEEDVKSPADRKLILQLGIMRHSFPNFEKHPEHLSASKAAIYYPRVDLDSELNWLPYVQWLYKEAKPFLDKFKNREIHLCLAAPSVIAFALGMALSRTPNITVCDFQSDKYVPVFSLREIERSKLPFS